MHISTLEQAKLKGVNYLQENYITVFDDSRVDINVARKLKDNKKAQDLFLKKLLKMEHQEQFPIENIDALNVRCQEILIVFGDIKFYALKHIIHTLTKMSFKKYRVLNNKAEMAIAVEFLNLFDTFGCNDSLYSLFNFQESDITPEDGFATLLGKLQIFTSCLTWTQSSVGLFVHSSATEKS